MHVDVDDILNETTSSDEEVEEKQEEIKENSSDGKPSDGKQREDTPTETVKADEELKDVEAPVAGGKSDSDGGSDGDQNVDFPSFTAKEEVKSEGAVGGALSEGQNDSTEGLNDFNDIDSGGEASANSARGNKEDANSLDDLDRGKRPSAMTDAVKSFAERFQIEDPNAQDITKVRKTTTEIMKDEYTGEDPMQRRKSKDEDEGLDINKLTQTRQGMSRASNIFRSFTAGFNSRQMVLPKKDQEEKKKEKEEDEKEISEDEQKRLLAAIMDDDSSNEESDSDAEVSQNSAGLVKAKDAKDGSDSGSFCSDNDIYNRDLDMDCGEAIDSQNYLRYASDKYN